MTRSNERLTALRTAEPVENRWWITLPFPYLVGAIQFLAIVVTPASSYPSPGSYVAVSRFLAVLFVLTLGVALLGLYFDIAYVAEVSEWKPSTWHSLMFVLPAVGVAIGLHYLYRRSRHVGLLHPVRE